MVVYDLASDLRNLLVNVVRWGMKNVAYLVGICSDEMFKDNSIISTRYCYFSRFNKIYGINLD